MRLAEQATRIPGGLSEPPPGPQAQPPAELERVDRDALVAELDVLRALLRGEDPEGARALARAAAARLAAPSPLDTLVAALGLSQFERAVLLLGAGQELVAAVAVELATATGTPSLTFGTALGLLPGAHWSAVTPDAPLRHWGLVTLDDPLVPARSPLVVDERIVNHLVGAGGVDARLEHLAHVTGPTVPLPRALRAAADQLAGAWRTGPVILLGDQPDNCRAVAAAAAERAGTLVREIAAADLPTEPAELVRIVRLLTRETLLANCGWLLSLDDVAPDVAARIVRACARVDGHLVLLAPGTGGLGQLARCAVVDVPRLDLDGRAELLTSALRAAGATLDDVPVVAGVFDLTVAEVTDVARDVASGTPLWAASLRRCRVEAGGAARRIEPRATWDDLVLPDAQISQLRSLVSAVRHRGLVLDRWGFARRTSRGLGTTSLFAGASGTGKSLAAEIVAHELGLDLLHVDLSQVMSKYIGETEKNLAAVFDAAERGSAVLLFDEADTLFGKRSEVRDSHDRYANLEVGYLLQRMEQFRGLAILTTNARSSLDQAFLRRLHTVVSFPYPDSAARARMWRIAFPRDTPTDDVDFDALAQVDVPGGAISAAALVAAYLAAGNGAVVTTAHVRQALGWELAKSGRTVAASRESVRPSRVERPHP